MQATLQLKRRRKTSTLEEKCWPVQQILARDKHCRRTRQTRVISSIICGICGISTKFHKFENLREASALPVTVFKPMADRHEKLSQRFFICLWRKRIAGATNACYNAQISFRFWKQRFWGSSTNSTQLHKFHKFHMFHKLQLFHKLCTLTSEQTVKKFQVRKTAN